MKQFLGLFVVGLLCAVPLAAQAKVNIFACEPEWAALAEEIGGDKVEAFSATHAGQNPHHIRARPSLIAKARNADLIICSGAGLEVGWLPILLQKASAEVQPGAVGHIMASEFVPILEKPLEVDRSMGDVHPEGNPHVHLNPHNILLVAAVLTKRLESIDIANADFYRSQSEDFTSRWQKAISRWEKEAVDLKGKPVVVYHKSFSYLLDWLELKQVASLEPKPGIPPTASHLEGLLQQLKAKPAKVIIRTPYEPNDAGKWLSEKTGTPAVVLPYTIDGDTESSDLYALFDRSIGLLKEAIDGK
ncbi:MAG: zinc ABC transporter substrate-binding protein [Rickettsiales bacterium]|nr:zinc ABC transporter substrate-binding protein [Pseudomonadota bacterium]MDA0967013.1 zinc ABC transporter substrate-binding protein [Pseudomonadota bacterium]MDG4543933.1 zinc ABC transporter substrate-binding protein [Rickettsiales bacterium]MDG4546079.1 zinc ABC transporter substrate-binding protein [Rickettsiales bacterium]MDG4548325.1 zinc ABC transporter substrate-binding protein [Rickettsiales bacterium]